MAILRVMLDTNLWSYVGDAGLGLELYEEFSRRGLEVIVPPSVLLELARTPDAGISARHIAAILSGTRKQLCSEAELVCGELIEEVRRLRPDWLLAHPDPGSVRPYHRFWQTDIWRAARTDWAGLVEHLRERGLANGVDRRSLEDQRRNKAALAETEVKLDLNDLWASLTEESDARLHAVWPDERVEAWRAQTWITNLTDLRSYAAAERAGDPDAWRLPGATMSDWLRAAIDTRIMLEDEAGFAEFWLSRVEARRMPRTWLLWAVLTLQLKTKLGIGNAADVQHAQYLPDCHVFVSADARYVRVLNAVAEQAPFSTPRIVLVDGGPRDAWFKRIVAALSSL